ncbi:hypothetical protein ACA910_022330 [Epithemia clementina (nom. ined.)]
MVRNQMPSYTATIRSAPPAAPQKDVGALQDEIKALEAKLAQAREQEEDLADPDGDYIEEEYEEEVMDDDDYVVEEIVDDGAGDDEIIEIVEYDEEEYEEEVVEEPPSPPPRPPAPVFGGGGGGGGGGRGALLAAIQARGGQTGVDSGVAAKAPSANRAPTSSSSSSSSFGAKPAANKGPPNKAAAAPAASPAPRNARPPAAAAAAAPPASPKPGPGGRAALNFSAVKLKPTGITLAEEEVDSPYSNKGPPPKARPAQEPPKAVPARDAPKAVDKPKNFLKGVQDADDRAAQAEAQALKAVEDDEDAQTRKKWVPMKERNPEKYPKTSIEVREAPLKKTTKLQPLPFKQRQYPSVPASPSGQETPVEKILGPYLYKNSKLDRFTTTSAMKDQDILILYFGAAWRSGCKVFQQQIIDFYKMTSRDCNLECVYISADRTLFEFKDVYSKFPFLAIPTGTVELKNQMTQDFNISDVPTLVVLNAQTGHLITTEGVEELANVPARDRDLAQKLVNDWKQRKATPVRGGGGGGGGDAARAPATSSAPPASSDAATVVPAAGNQSGLQFGMCLHLGRSNPL